MQAAAGQQHEYKQYQPAARCAAAQYGCLGTAQRQVSSISTSSIGQQPGVQQHSLASTAPGQLSF